MIEPVVSLRQVTKPGQLYAKHHRAGFRLRANVTRRVELFENDQRVFSATYHTDKFGRRTLRNPPSPGRPKKEFLAIFGASTVFGMGLEDQDTLAFQLESMAPGFQVLNFACDGYGPQSAYALVESGVLRTEVEQLNGFALYFLTLLPGPGGHVQTLLGGAQLTVREWGENLTFYGLEDRNDPVFLGNFREAYPFRFFALRFFQQFQLFNLLARATGSGSDSEYQKLLRILQAWGGGVQGSAVGRHPVVVIHPFSDSLSVRQFLRVWNQRPLAGFRVLDYSEKLNEREVEALTAFYKYVRHPNRELNRRLAIWIVEDLGLGSSQP